MNQSEKARRAADYKSRVDLIHLSFQEIALPHQIEWFGNRCKFIFKCPLCGKQGDKFVHPYKYFYMNCRYCIGRDVKIRNQKYQNILSLAYT